MEDVPVILALGRGQHGIRLHADEGQVSRVAEDGCDAARGQGAHGRLPEGHVLPWHLRHVHELVVEAKARARVDHLARETRREALVERGHSLVGQHGPGDGHRVRGSALCCAQLDPHLHHVDGLDAARCNASGETPRDERLACLPRVHGSKKCVAEGPGRNTCAR